MKRCAHPKAITQTAIDMSPACLKGARENFGNAHIVFDKFHGVSQVAKALEAVRRQEARPAARRCSRGQRPRSATHWKPPRPCHRRRGCRLQIRPRSLAASTS